MHQEHSVNHTELPAYTSRRVKPPCPRRIRERAERGAVAHLQQTAMMIVAVASVIFAVAIAYFFVRKRKASADPRR